MVVDSDWMTALIIFFWNFPKSGMKVRRFIANISLSAIDNGCGLVSCLSVIVLCKPLEKMPTVKFIAGHSLRTEDKNLQRFFLI